MTAPEAVPALRVEGLVRRFGEKTAVDGLTLSVPRGSFYGLAGPNGSGKTTTLRMVTGLLRPDAGSIEIAGTAVWPDPVPAKRRLGFVPDNPDLFDRLTAAEMLDFAGLLHGMDPAVVVRRRDELLHAFDLVGDSDKVLADFSLGMTKRIGLAVALLHSPGFLVLDEPFGSLDPVNAKVMEDTLKRFCANGGTVLFSSHVLDVVERLCDRVAIIEAGRLRAEGTVQELTRGQSLQNAFVDLIGGRELDQGELGWLGSSSD